MPSALHAGYLAAMNYGSPEVGNSIATILPLAFVTRYISRDEESIGERTVYAFAETPTIGCGSTYVGFILTEGAKLASQLF